MGGRYAAVSTSDLRPEALDALHRRGGGAGPLARPRPAPAAPRPGALPGARRRSTWSWRTPAHGAARRPDAPAAGRGAGGGGAAGAGPGEDPLGLHGRHRRRQRGGLLRHQRLRGGDARHRLLAQRRGGGARSRRPPPRGLGRQRQPLLRRARAGRGGGAPRRRAGALAGSAPRRGESAVLPMVVEARAAGKLVGQLLGPLHGAPLQQQRSFLEGRMGQAIGSPLLDLRDDPLVPRAFGSRLFDGEGLAARPRPVVERGVLAQLVPRHLLRPEAGAAADHRPAVQPALALRDPPARGAAGRCRRGCAGHRASSAATPTGPPATSRSGCEGSAIRRGQVAEPVGGDERLRQPPRALEPAGRGRR